MRTKAVAALAALVAMAPGSGLHPLPAAAAEMAVATVTFERPDASCAGDGATLAWIAPEGTADLTGYQIVRTQYTPTTPVTTRTSVGPEQTRLAFTIPYDNNIFLIYAVTSTGVQDPPFAIASVFGNRAPTAMAWSPFSAFAVGDGAATMTYAWPGPIWQSHAATGGVLPTKIRITASPGGATLESPAPHDADGVLTTFTGLTNGTAYTFNGVTSNACGSSSAATSPIYVPGVRPTWVQADPPLVAKKNKSYAHQFMASGTPAPTYSLRDAPAWLTVSPDGVVVGEPPKETTTFSYAVVAENGVGIHNPYPGPPVIAGPFTVSVTRGQPEVPQPRP